MARRREDVHRYPTSFAEAKEMLGTRGSKRIDNNTWLEYQYNMLYAPSGVIGIRLHNTYVVTFYSDGQVELNSGGYRSVTTKSRINAVLPGWMGISQRDYEWYLFNRRTNMEHTFYDGITLELVS